MSIENISSELENEKHNINKKELSKLLAYIATFGEPDQRHEAQQLEEFLGY